MPWWRRSWLARTVVMVLLLWTAADLTNSSLCALDDEGLSATVPVTAGATTIDQGSPSQIPPPQPAKPHIDDCFCCSHCVEVQGLAPALASASVNRTVQPLVLPAPRIFGARLYHPPLV